MTSRAPCHSTAPSVCCPSPAPRRPRAHSEHPGMCWHGRVRVAGHPEHNRQDGRGGPQYPGTAGGHRGNCWAINLLAGPPRGRAAHDIYVGDLSAMQFNIPGPLACVFECMAPSSCHPCHPPSAHPLTWSLSGSVSCPPTVLSPCTHSGRTGPGRAEPPRVPGQRGGVVPPGCSWHRPSAVPTRAPPGCPAAGGWRQGPWTGSARRTGTASPVPAPPG